MNVWFFSALKLAVSLLQVRRETAKNSFNHISSKLKRAKFSVISNTGPKFASIGSHQKAINAPLITLISEVYMP